jgi:Ca2+-binding RTX toxin-like protein
MKLAGIPAVGLVVIALMAVPRMQVASVQAAADPTHSTIVKLIGDGELQVTAPDFDTGIQVLAQSPDQPVVVTSDRPVIAAAPCVAVQNGGLPEAQCPFDQVKSVLVLTSTGDDVVITIVQVPVTVITGGGSDDVVNYTTNSSLILLGDGDDFMSAREVTGASEVFGGPGVDLVHYLLLPREIEVAVSLDDIANDGPLDVTRDDNIHSDVENIEGGDGADILIGSDSNNLILGDGGNDTIRGLGGDDTMIGGLPTVPDPDLLDGGAGADTVDYFESSAPVNVSLDGLANDGSTGELDNVINTENIIGSHGNDTLTGNAAGNIIQGLGGADVIDGAAGTDTVSYDDRSVSVNVSLDSVANDGSTGELDDVLNTENIIGGNGDDTLTGNASGNVIRGLGGDDTIAGGAGADVIDGGAGTDTATYADHAAAVVASLDGLANDGSTGELDNVINTENLIGGGGSDTLTGSAGPNFLRGLGGNDQLRGLAGNDLLIGDAGSDLADGGAGSDLCQAERVLSCP